MATAEKVIAERLPDLGGWELYRLALEHDDDVVATIALRRGAGGVEYGVWRQKDAEPSATGLLALALDRAASGAWSDVARELTLQEILAIYAAEMPELRGGVVFKLDDDDDDADDDDDDADDDDDDDT